MNPARLLSQLVPTLYEDEYLLVVDKPPGLDLGGPRTGGGHAVSTSGLVDILREQLGTDAILEPVNRLSRFESGICILAKNRATAQKLRGDLRNGELRQTYLAVVRGKMEQLSLELTGTARNNRRGKPGTSRKPSGRKSTSPNATKLLRVKHRPRRQLLRCMTTTATTHALRAQLRGTGLRLLGDVLHQRSVHRAKHEDTCLHLLSVTLKPSHLKKNLVLTSNKPDGFEQALQEQTDHTRLLAAAMATRFSMLTDRSTNAYRLLNGDTEGVPGVVAERFGSVVILQIRSEAKDDLSTHRPLARWFRRHLKIDAVYTKQFLRDRASATAGAPEDPHPQKPFVGVEVPQEIEILERGLKFIIRPYDGFSVGLFLDHRDNRSRIRSLANDKDVLNLFAYTCGFSVAAAAGGARSTVSIDISKKNLDWGRANFELNSLAGDAHEFFNSDAFEFLKRGKRQGKSFDLIVLDPPSFAHGRGRGTKQTFSIIEDLPRLVTESAQLLRPGGTMMVSTNHRKMSIGMLRSRIRDGVAGRKLKITDTPPLPPDFASDPEFAKTVFVTLG